MKIRASEILSKLESRKAPLGVVFFFMRATLPSTMSKKPERNSMILAKICEWNWISCPCKKYVIPKKMLDSMANPNPTILQKVGDKFSEPKLIPISVIMGINFSLKLLSKYYHIICTPIKYSYCYM